MQAHFTGEARRELYEPDRRRAYGGSPVRKRLKKAICSKARNSTTDMKVMVMKAQIEHLGWAATSWNADGDCRTSRYVFPAAEGHSGVDRPVYNAGEHDRVSCRFHKNCRAEGYLGPDDSPPISYAHNAILFISSDPPPNVSSLKR